MDAFEKLQHLGLKGQQEREIVHVLLACCLQEKSYNPYYAVLGQKLCDFDRKYQVNKVSITTTTVPMATYFFFLSFSTT